MIINELFIGFIKLLAKINETDTFGPEDEECNFEFDVDEVYVYILYKYVKNIIIILQITKIYYYYLDLKTNL